MNTRASTAVTLDPAHSAADRGATGIGTRPDHCLLVPERACGATGRGGSRFLWATRLVALVAVLGATPVAAQNIVQTFFVPLPDDQVRTSLARLYASTGQTMDSVISIVSTGTGTRIYYDHWEDGFELDLENPVQATSQVWGDGNPANGLPPGHATDVLSHGDVIALRNLVTLPRNPTQIRYDGRDRIGSTRALAVTRAAWATSPGPVLSDAVSVSSTRDYGTVFSVPIGEDVAASSMFEYVSLAVMASENGTMVEVDKDADGSVDQSQTLNRGESMYVDGGVLAGATITASKPVQAHLLTGDVNANYESRWYNLYPNSDWSSSYYTPVGTASDGDQTYVFFYNPGAAPLTVNYDHRSGSGSVVVAAGGTTQFLMPQNSGAHFYSSGDPFFALATVGANPTANNIHDWGFTLIPEALLTTRAVVGWGPGSGDLSANGSPVWVTAIAATTVFVDYDGDPGTGLLGPDLNGDRYDLALDMDAFESARIYDPDRDQTGMRLYTLDGTQIAAAYGQDPAVAGAGNPFLDLGTTILPLPVPIVIKSSRLLVDDGNPVPPGGNGLVDAPADVLEYSITVRNEGVIVLGNIIVVDTPPAPLLYVPNSMMANGVPVPDDVVPPALTAFPLDEAGYVVPLLDAGESIEFTYQATVLPGTTSVENVVAIYGVGDIVTDDNTVPVNSPSVTLCALAFTDGSGAGVGGYLPGQDVYVTLTDGDQNTNPLVAEVMEALVTNPTTGDAETVSLTETGLNTGVFRNLVGLPFSSVVGQATQDGTLHAHPGNTLDADYEDSAYGDTCADTAAVSPPTETKYLYLSSDGSDGDIAGSLDRIDPVNVVPADGTTSQTTVLGASGTIAVDATSSNSGNGALANLDVAHTTGGGANRLMLVGISVEDDSPSGLEVSSITWTVGGTVQNLTQVGTTVVSDEPEARIYRMIAPTSGAGTLRVNFTGAGASDAMVVGVTTFTGVDQTTPLGTFASNDGSSGTATVNVTSAAGELVFDTMALDDARGATVGAGQTSRWDVDNGAPGDGVTGSSSTEAGAASVTMSWTVGSDNWAIAAVPIRPAPATTSATFTQSPSMASSLTMPAATSVGVTTCIDVVSGAMPGSPDITATLRRDGTAIATMNPATYVASSAACAAGPALVWSHTLAADVTVTAGQVVNLEVTSAEAGVSFEIEYDSNSRSSFVSLPTTTVITVDSVAVYDAAYPSGNLLSTGYNGQTVYVRTTVSDPFGAADITSLDLSIDDPLGANVVSTTLTDSDVVNATGVSKTYEYEWSTPGADGVYPIEVIAHEGYEGTIIDSAATQITVSPLDTGTPSQTEFTTGLNGAGTPTYAANEQVCIRVTDLDENTDPLTIQTISVVITSSSGDSEVVPLVPESGVNTGIFVACIPASSSVPGAANNGTLYAPTGSVLTVDYVDDDDATDTSSDVATVPAAGPSVSISKALADPVDGTANVGDSVEFELVVTNNGSSLLNTVTVTDTFPLACLTFDEASPVQTTVVGNTITWNNVGPLAVGSSIALSVRFEGTGSCAPGVNAASVSGTASAGPASANVTITGPSVAVSKTRTTASPATIGSTVTFTIDISNDGDTIIDVLPLADSYSTCLEFQSSVPASDGAGGGAAVWDDLLPGAATLAPGATTSVTVNFTVVDACNPALNQADVSFAIDANGDLVAPDSDSDDVITQAASISGQVRNDIEADGDLGDVENGIPNTVIRLYTDPNEDGDPSDGVIAGVQLTDANGEYSFTGLNAGSYVVVEEDRPPYYSTADSFGLNDNWVPVTVVLIQDYPNNDFLDSTYQAASVAGVVYEDVDGDGSYDANIDVPQSGVDVSITDSAGVVHVVSTNVNGFFSHAVPAGNTTIDVDASTILDIVSPSLTTDAFGEGSDPTIVYAPAGGVAIDNTGYVSSPNVGTVDGTVYVDVDGDGNYTLATDTPLAGVEVTITDANGGVYQVTTDASGYFSQLVPAGVTEVDVVDSTLTVGATLDSGSTDPTTVNVPNGGTATDDTGYLLPASTGLVNGTVYLDIDLSGTFNGGDTPLPGVAVEITDSQGNVHTVTSDASGYFEWPVPPGATIVDIVDTSLPSGVTLTSNASNEGSDSTLVTVPAGGTATDNTGYLVPATLGVVEGTIYHDVDGNGAFTPGVDSPWAGVEVEITDINGGTYSVLTNGSGFFSQIVPGGATTVDVNEATLPVGAILDSGSSDPTVVVVPDGGEATDNTGYTLPAATGIVNGTIYLDDNGNGLYDPSDTALPNIEVAITDSLGGVHVVLTDGDGYFEWPVIAGHTIVDILDATLPLDASLTSDASGEGSDPTIVYVPINGVGTDNTGFVLPASLGTVDGTVFVDENGDGVYTPGIDTPLAGVEVLITTSNGGAYTVVTDVNGYFSQVVPAGSTTVDVVNATLPAGVSLTAGSTDPTAVIVPTNGTATDDTGYVLPVNYGLVDGTIYLDNDLDGTLSGGDTVLFGVEVEITDSLGATHVVTTDFNGYFSWPVPAGDTTVDVRDASLPAGVTLTNDGSDQGSDPTEVYVPANGVGTDNTGYVLPVAIGTVDGTVYVDENGDGVYTPGVDTPLAGVEVVITDVNGGVYTVLTDASGYFSQVVPAGNTTVDVTDATLPAGANLTGGSSDPTVVNVPASGTISDDTGYVLPASSGLVEGTVYIDENGDGLYTMGVDTPLSGIDVQITDSLGGVHVLSTDASGYFARPVPAGDTTVDVVDASLPAGVTLTNNGNGEGNDPTLVYVPANGVASDNTGYVQPVALGTVDGTVYVDENNDGAYTPGIDTPLVGVEVVVTDVNGGVYTVVTDASGYFSQVVPAGDATVDVDDTTLPTGANLTAGSTDPTVVNVPASGTASDDTGYVLPANTGLVEGTVYIDANGDGLYTLGVDTPLQGVDVEITDSLGGVQVVSTDASGYFVWPVPAGDTTVDVDEASLPAGVTLTNNGNGEGSDPSVVYVPANGTGTDNTGYVQPLAVGTVDGTVYVDENSDGVYTPGLDTPLAGVEVVITDVNGGVYTVITDASGHFSQLVPAGNTTVDLNDATLPAGATLTGGSTDPTVVTVPANGTISDNTGYVLPATSGLVEGTIYLDENSDGQYTMGVDTPLQGVEVEISDSLGGVQVVSTDGNGYFVWPVPAGDTTVDVLDASLPVGVILTTNVNGEGSDSTVVFVPANGVATDNTGYTQPPPLRGTVDGTIYIDENGNGVYNPGVDTPLSGVEVLITASNGGVYTVLTDASGYFSQLVAVGSTTVDVVDATLPGGASLTLGNSDPTVVVVPSGGTATDDTGYVLPANAGLVEGTIYIDENGDGLYTLGVDTPLQGIAVEISDSLGGVQLVSTDASGYFAWPVPAGDTTVNVVDNSLPAGVTLTSDGNGEGSDPTVVFVPANGVGSDNTGYVQPAALGTADGVVYIDADGDGVYTPGVDTPLVGVEVVITDVNGGVYTVVTDVSGHFSQVVPAGNTTVDVNDATLPAGANLTGGSSDPTVVNVPASGTATDDTGYVLPANAGLVEGTIYLDNDGNGVLSGGDTVLQGIDVEITDSLGGSQIITTDANGYFWWPVPAGDTTVDVLDASLPAGVTLTNNSSGEGSDPTVVYVPANGVGTDNTGYLQPPMIGTVQGTVYIDENGDGVYSPGVDTPLAGVEVLITDANGGAYTILTDADGYFSQVVPAGNTTVDVVDATLPASASLTAGSSDPTVVNVPANGAATDNTGYVVPANIGLVQGTVYFDADGDGLWTLGIDTPLQGVDVEITDVLGRIQIVSTNASGYFSWPVAPGQTVVDVVDATLPAGMTLTNNSNGDGSDSSTVMVPNGGVATDNTGYVQPAALGVVDGTIFADENGDGVFSPGVDTPLVGVSVVITDVDGGIYTVVTDSAGYFSQQVPAGNATVDVAEGSLPTGSSLTVGSTDPTIVAVPANGTATDDTGYVMPPNSGLVDGTIYIDENFDGVYTFGTDTPLQKIAVTITNSMGATHVVTTDDAGYFVWPVPQGNTIVDIDAATVPAQTTLTNDSSGQGSDPTIVLVPANGVATDNTGFVLAALVGTVQGTIFRDQNGDGVYTLGVDTPLAGVNVLVTDRFGTVTTVATNANGFFSQVVPAGSTTVDVADATLPPGLALAPGSTDSTTVNVPAGGFAVDNNGYLLAPTPTPTHTGTPTPTATPTPDIPPDLWLQKSHVGAFTVGSTGTYNFIVTNLSEGGTQGTITLSDPLPNGLSFVSGGGSGWNCAAAGQAVTCTSPGPILPGGSSSLSITVLVGSAAFPTVNNIATVIAAGDTKPNNNTDSDATVIALGPGASTPTSAAGSPTATSTAPGATATPTRTPTGPTATPTRTPTGPTATPTRTATPTATATPADPPDLWLQKSHVGSFTVGQTGTYNFIVTNLGKGATVGSISLTDPLPTGLSFVSGSGSGWSCSASGQLVTCTSPGPIAPGGTSTLAIVVNVGSTAFPTITNVASVDVAGDTKANNDSDADATLVKTGTAVSTPTSAAASPTATPTGPPATPTPSQEPSPTGTPYVDVALVKSNTGSFTQCEIGTFDYQVRNMGHSGSTATVGAITITDTLPRGLSFESFVGEGWSCSASGQVVSCTHAAALAVNSAAYLKILVYVGEEAFPTINSSASVMTAYDANPTNNFEWDSNVVRRGDCGGPATPTPTRTHTAVAGTPTATRTAATATPTPTPTMTATPFLDVAFVKNNTGSFTQCAVGTFDYQVRNMGNSGTESTVGPITITDLLPAGLSYVSSQGDGWSCAESNHVVTCIYPAPLALNETTNLSISVYVGEEAYPTVLTSASVMTPYDSNLENNFEWDHNVVRRGDCGGAATPTPGVATPTPTATPTSGANPDGCDLDVSTRYAGIPRAGETIEYRLTWAHSCRQPIDLLVAHTIPDGMEFVAVDVRDAAVETLAGTVLLRQSNRSTGSGTAVIQARILHTVPEGSVLCGAAMGDNSLGGSATAEACLTVLAASEAQRTSIQAPLLAPQGSEFSYAFVYSGVTQNNRLVLEIPEQVILGSVRPAPDSVFGRTLIWNDVPAPAGRVTADVSVGAGVAADTLLSMASEFDDDIGREFQQREVMVVQSSAGATHIGAFVLAGPRSLQAGQEASVLARYKRIGGQAVVSVQLPPELVLVSAVPPATTTSTGGLRWNLTGTAVSPASGSIKIKVRVADTVAPGRSLSAYASLAAANNVVNAEYVVAIKDVQRRNPSKTTLSVPRRVVPGLETQLRVKVEKMPAPAIVELTLPPQLVPLVSYPDAVVTESGKLRWTFNGAPGALISATAKVRVLAAPGAGEVAVLMATATASSSAGTTVSSGVMEVRQLTGASGGAAAALTLSGSKSLAPGVVTTLKIKYDGLSSAGRLELELPPTLDPVVLALPAANRMANGRLEWHSLAAPSGSLSVKVMVSPGAPSGQLMTVTGTLSDGSGRTTNTKFATSVR